MFYYISCKTVNINNIAGVGPSSSTAWNMEAKTMMESSVTTAHMFNI